jgi:YesN/AraC family two-component response regulator
VHVAADPETARKIVSTNPVDVAVLDVRMPGTDGLTLFKELKQLQPSLLAIFLTGFGDKQSVQAAIRLGAENVIDKPFNYNYLRLSLVRAVEKSHQERLIREILELFVMHYTKLDFAKFEKLQAAEKERTLQAALGVARLQIMNRKQAARKASAKMAPGEKDTKKPAKKGKKH